MKHALHIITILATLLGLNDRACAQFLICGSNTVIYHTHADCHHHADAHSHGEKEAQNFDSAAQHTSCEASTPLKTSSQSTDCTDGSCHHHSCGLAPFAITANHDKISLLVLKSIFLPFQPHMVGLPEEVFFSEDKPPLI